jgi:hypothetical protein
MGAAAVITTNPTGRSLRASVRRVQEQTAILPGRAGSTNVRAKDGEGREHQRGIYSPRQGLKHSMPGARIKPSVRQARTA